MTRNITLVALFLLVWTFAVGAMAQPPAPTASDLVCSSALDVNEIHGLAQRAAHEADVRIHRASNCLVVFGDRAATARVQDLVHRLEAATRERAAHRPRGPRRATAPSERSSRAPASPRNP